LRTSQCCTGVGLKFEFFPLMIDLNTRGLSFRKTIDILGYLLNNTPLNRRNIYNYRRTTCSHLAQRSAIAQARCSTKRRNRINGRGQEGRTMTMLLQSWATESAARIWRRSSRERS
jgi:hypothetical protein